MCSSQENHLEVVCCVRLCAQADAGFASPSNNACPHCHTAVARAVRVDVCSNTGQARIALQHIVWNGGCLLQFMRLLRYCKLSTSATLCTCLCYVDCSLSLLCVCLRECVRACLCSSAVILAVHAPWRLEINAPATRDLTRVFACKGVCSENENVSNRSQQEACVSTCRLVGRAGRFRHASLFPALSSSVRTQA